MWLALVNVTVPQATSMPGDVNEHTCLHITTNINHCSTIVVTSLSVTSRCCFYTTSAMYARNAPWQIGKGSSAMHTCSKYDSRRNSTKAPAKGELLNKAFLDKPSEKPIAHAVLSWYGASKLVTHTQLRTEYCNPRAHAPSVNDAKT